MGNLEEKYACQLDKNIPSNNIVNPQNTIEERLLEIWQQVFDVETISTEENFFSLGGNSLLAIRILFSIEEEFCVGLDTETFYLNPSIVGLGGIIVRKQMELSTNDIIMNLKEESGCNLSIEDITTQGGNIRSILVEGDTNNVMELIAKKYDFLKVDYVRNILETDNMLKSNGVNENEETLCCDESMKENITSAYFALQGSFNLKSIVKSQEIGYTLSVKINRYKNRRRMIRLVSLDYFDYEGSILLKEKLKNFIDCQNLLKSVVQVQNDVYYLNEVSRIHSIEPKVIDLSNLSFDERDNIARKTIMSMGRNLQEQEVLNTPLYNILFLKYSEFRYKILMCIDDIFAGGDTKRVVNYFFNVKNPDYDVPSLSNFIEDVFVRTSKEKFNQYISSNMYHEHINAINNFRQMHKQHEIGNKIEFSDKVFLEFEIKALLRQDMFKEQPLYLISLYISLVAISKLFHLPIVPFRIFNRRRTFCGVDYYNTIGDFDDCLPTTFNMRDNTFSSIIKRFLMTEEWFKSNEMLMKGLIQDVDWSMPIYRHNPFIFNYLGELEFENDSRVYEVGYTGTVEYPIVSFCNSDKRLYIVMQNGLLKEDEKIIEKSINDLDISVTITRLKDE